jgi:hypothetical protein
MHASGAGYPSVTPEHNALSPRMRRISLVSLTLVLACALSATAQAWTPPPTDDSGRLARFLPIARAAWPDSPCAGRELVHLAGDTALRAEAPFIAGAHEGLNGMAAPETCEVWLSSAMSAQTFCTVLVHEFGHLAGRLHTTEPGDLMNGEGDVDYEPCDRLTVPPAGADQVEEELRTILPAPRAAWRVTCGAKRGGERRCVARRGRSVRRYEVTETRTTVTVARLGD